ncbi:MAG: hypothetical protein LCH70_07650 [Proteobacteria bacterium]|nr:hypothetical protein [Pseudomonadota bacterium]
MIGPSVAVNTPGVTSPFGLLRFAEEYRAAAGLVMAAKDPPKHSAPAFMLVGHSIELSLKAFLLARGVPLDALRLKPYGHDLVALLQEAQRRRIDRLVPLHDFHVDAIRLIAPVHGRHEFRYLVTGVRTLPQWGFIAHAAAELTRCQHDWLLRRRIGKAAAARRIALRGKF